MISKEISSKISVTKNIVDKTLLSLIKNKNNCQNVAIKNPISAFNNYPKLR